MARPIDMSDPTTWPAELDALIAAPDHHTLLLEDDDVRVLDTVIRAGDRTPVHTHRWPATFVVLGWSSFVRYDADGNVMLDSRQVPNLATAPTTMPSDPIGPHALENVGDGDIRIISIEYKR